MLISLLLLLLIDGLLLLLLLILLLADDDDDDEDDEDEDDDEDADDDDEDGIIKYWLLRFISFNFDMYCCCSCCFMQSIDDGEDVDDEDEADCGNLVALDLFVPFFDLLLLFNLLLDSLFS